MLKNPVASHPLPPRRAKPGHGNREMEEVRSSQKCPHCPASLAEQGWPSLLGMLDAYALKTSGPGARSPCSQGSFGHCEGLLNLLDLQARLGAPGPLPELQASSGHGFLAPLVSQKPGRCEAQNR